MAQTKYGEGPGYLIAEVEGEWDQKDAEREIITIRDEAIRRGQTRLLLDLRGLSPPRSGMTKFFTGEYIAKVLGYPFKLAALATRELYDGGFAENVAVNRGANLLTFFEREDALEWLLSGSNETTTGDGS